MGADKAAIRLDGVTQAVRLGELLRRVARVVVEVGPSRSGLASIEEQPRGEGPLVAIAAGARWLEAHGHRGPAIVLACDLPLLGLEMIELLARWPGGATVLPVVDAREQPLCARWSHRDLHEAVLAVAAGERSLARVPLRSGTVRLEEQHWGSVASAVELRDVDTRADLAALQLGARVELPDAS